MLSLRTTTSLHRCAKRLWPTGANRRFLHDKYAQKVQEKAQRQGLTIEQLRETARTAAKTKQKAEVQSLKSLFAPQQQPQKKAVEQGAADIPEQVRSDSSPVKPLSNILNLAKIRSLTPAQVSALWTAYHASRSEGTGRGFLCAAVPIDIYKKMADVAAQYPLFVIPLPRQLEDGTTAHEFFLVEWTFHEAPPSAASEQNPRISTVLFTSLEEYKLRQSFATPYLVLTHYTDLIHSHETVLLRGEITPGKASGYLLSQEDAQVLSIALQKFYLWSDDKEGLERQALLRSFHEKQDQFNWEDLLKHGKVV